MVSSRLPRLARTILALAIAASAAVSLPTASHATDSFGSARFDGSTGYLNAGSSTDWDIGTGDFTVEWFQYQTDTNSFPRIFTIGTYPSAKLALSIESGTAYVWVNGSYQITYSLGGQSNYFHKWVHFAITRASGSLNFYVNGTRVGTAAYTANILSSGLPLNIGRESASFTYFPGFISNFHFVNGTALYSAGSLMVPTSPITAVANTKLLLKFESSANFLVDSSGTSKTVSAVGAVSYNENNPFNTSAPLAPILKTATNGFAGALEWDIPAYNGGSPITDYEYQLDSGSWTSMSTTGTTYSLPGLTTSATYTVKVRAVNAIGNGAASNAITFTVGAPLAPSLSSATVTASNVALVWTVPSDSGSAITDYQYELNDSGTWVSMSTTGTTFTITGLSSGAYSVRVRAINAVGNGGASNARSFTLASVPQSPTLTSATATTTGAQLVWTAPSDGGSAITNYEYELNASGSWVSMGTTGTSYTITGLTGGTYSVKVRAVNAVGAGGASSPQSFTVVAGCDRTLLSKAALGNCLKNSKKP